MVLCEPKVILGPWQKVRPPHSFLMSKLVVVKIYGKLNHENKQPDRGYLRRKYSLSCVQN